MTILNDKMTVRNEEPQILSLKQSHISIAAKMMADTFFVDPLSCYLIPNERYRLESLEKAWRKTINHDFPLGHVYCSEQSDRNTSTALDNLQILGIASWLPPNAKSPSLLGSLPLILEIFLQNGAISTKRILNTLTKTEAYRLRDCPTPHWYLEGLGVSPKAQSKGIGSLLLQPVLQQADRQGEICYLFTSTDRAVKFYQRHGFVVREELRVLKDAPPLWMMMRSPQA
ncbi:GNAT family N-acetyltransferase [Phormidium tenue]|uniref:GNAT family N-acetyltransferase n=1 Tax=Phormidium tenue FACHB-1050 TaxID=2692857 RepID=A0ABR8C3X2_9CYAN|nr:GNAT family N-acetyltransferase [Phormidium tenue]MBD2315439.1 GNAT family N-acetyltransferase [Phormidium tenue FACHB-1050]